MLPSANSHTAFSTVYKPRFYTQRQKSRARTQPQDSPSSLRLSSILAQARHRWHHMFLIRLNAIVTDRRVSHSQLSPFAVVSDRVGSVPLVVGSRRSQAVFVASRVSHHIWYCSQRLRLMLFTVCSHSYEEEIWHSGCRETMAWGHQVFWHTVYNIIRNQIRVFVIRIVCFQVDVVGDD